MGLRSLIGRAVLWAASGAETATPGRGGSEYHSGTRSPAAWLIEALTGGTTAAGEKVNDETALRASSVFAAIRNISEDIAGLPLKVFETVPDGKRPRPDHLYAPLLNRRANPESTAFMARQALVGSALLWGNGYARLVRRDNAQVAAIVPLWSPWVAPMRDARGELFYRYRVETAEGRSAQEDIPATDVVHITGFSTDGIVGRMQIYLGRESIGLTLAAERFGARLFANGVTPGGIVQHPGTLKPEGRDNLQRSLRRYATTERHGVLVLEEGATFGKTAIQPEESQFLETRQFQVIEVARWFRVPPHMIGALERATFSNIEMQSLEYVVFTLRSWLVRIEQELDAKLFTRPRDRRIFAEHSVAGLLRGDTPSRYEAYDRAINAGWLSPNEARRLENLNPFSGGDLYRVPTNMAVVDPATGELQSVASAPAPASGSTPGGDSGNDDSGGGTTSAGGEEEGG